LQEKYELKEEIKELSSQIKGMEYRLKKSGTAVSDEDKKLIEIGQKMKANQGKGKRQNKKIDNQFIKERYQAGDKPAEIHRQLQANGVKCTLKTVCNRIQGLINAG